MGKSGSLLSHVEPLSLFEVKLVQDKIMYVFIGLIPCQLVTFREGYDVSLISIDFC